MKNIIHLQINYVENSIKCFSFQKAVPMIVRAAEDL